MTNFELLIQAINACQELQVTNLLNQMESKDLSYEDKSSRMTPLCLAIKKGYLSIATLLINKLNPKDLSKAGSSEMTPLCLAISNEYLDTAKELIHRMLPKDLSKAGSSEMPPLCLAISKGHLGIAQELIHRMLPEDLSKAGSSEMPPLCLAISKEHLVIAKELMHKMLPGNLLVEFDGLALETISLKIFDKKLDDTIINKNVVRVLYKFISIMDSINLKEDDLAKKLLHWFLERSHIKAVNSLISIPDYDKIIRSIFNKLLEYIAPCNSSAGSAAVELVTLSYHDRMTLLSYLVCLPKTQAIESFIRDSAGHLIYTYKSGDTLLHIAACCKNGEPICLLLAELAPELLKIKNKNGDTPINDALINGRNDIVEILINSRSLKDLEDLKKNLEASSEESKVNQDSEESKVNIIGNVTLGNKVTLFSIINHTIEKKKEELKRQEEAQRQLEEEQRRVLANEQMQNHQAIVDAQSEDADKFLTWDSSDSYKSDSAEGDSQESYEKQTIQNSEFNQGLAAASLEAQPGSVLTNTEPGYAEEISQPLMNSHSSSKVQMRMGSIGAERKEDSSAYRRKSGYLEADEDKENQSLFAKRAKKDHEGSQKTFAERTTMPAVVPREVCGLVPDSDDEEVYVNPVTGRNGTVQYVTAQKFDNVLLNHPEILQKVDKNLFTRIINLRFEDTYKVLKSYGEGGFEKLRSTLIELEVARDLAQQKSNQLATDSTKLLADFESGDSVEGAYWSGFASGFEQLSIWFQNLHNALGYKEGSEESYSLQQTFLGGLYESVANSAQVPMGYPRRGHPDFDPGDFGHGSGAGENPSGGAMLAAGNFSVDISGNIAFNTTVNIISE